MRIHRIKSYIKNHKKITAILLIVLLGVFVVGFIFAQGLYANFRYPYRIASLARELNQAGASLSYLNNEVQEMIARCDCKNAQSQCSQGGVSGSSMKEVEMNFDIFNSASQDPSATIENILGEIKSVKKQTVNSINGLNLIIKTSKETSTINNKTRSLGTITTEIEQDLENALTKTKLSFSEIKNIENHIDTLNDFNNILSTEENSLESLKQKINNPLEQYNENIFEEAINSAENKLKQGLEEISSIPKQIENKFSQIIDNFGQQISQLPESLESMFTLGNKCNAVGVETFGEVCLERKEIQEREQEIRDKIDQINYLHELLQIEMTNGLEEELATLPDNEAEELRNSLNNILTLSENIVKPAQNNIDILNNGNYSSGNQCQASCKLEPSLSFNACIADVSGEQDPITLDFAVGASLENIELGEIGINEFSLNLPEKIDLSGLSKINELRIPLPNTSVSYSMDTANDLESLKFNNATIQPKIYNLPKLPSIGFGCPQTNNSFYQCKSKEEKTNSYNNLDWYLQTYSWLSDKCQQIPGVTDGNGLPVQERLIQCLDKQRVHSTIVNQCNSLWNSYNTCMSGRLRNDCEEPPEICKNIQGSQAITRECSNLFNKIGEPTPSSCDLNTLKNKCSQIKENNQEILEPCKYLPLFTGNFEDPETQTFQEEDSSCPSQTISDSSAISMDLNCLLSSEVSIPSINLPDLIIPDIQLPTFNLSPFAVIKLPSFIFEDLILSEMELCNLDDCLGSLPSLGIEVPYPTLRIPSIEIPPFQTLVPNPSGEGKVPIDIEIDKLEVPEIPIPMPFMDLAELISLELETPNIPIPAPKITTDFNLGGLNINLANLLLGLLGSFLDIPTGCISGGITGIPINISFADYYFYWPKFPDVPDLCNNEYINTQNFCSKVSNSLNNSEVLKKRDAIQKILNETSQKVQDKLDDVADIYQEVIAEHISENIEKINIKIEKEVRKALAELKSKIASGESISDEVVDIPLDDIMIPVEKINKALSKIPLKIPLSWPSELEKIRLSEPISYPLPSIPLDDLSFLKKKEFKLPGLHLPSFDFSLDLFGKYPGCKSSSPSGGNPYPTNEINVNINELTNLSSEINNFSGNIINILE